MQEHLHAPHRRERRAHDTAIRVAAASLLGAVLAGCATPSVESQWSDPAFNGQSLRGARLYVVCEAPDEALARVCQERLAAEVVAYGGTAEAAPARLASPTGRVGTADAYLPDAKRAGARAVLLTSIGPTARTVGSGPSVGIGLGGFGSGRVGGGLGISLPIGGAQVSTTYAANTLLTDVPSGKLMWTANTTTPSGDVNEQVSGLVKAAMTGAQKAGFF